MRHFFQPKAGRSLSISSGLHVASGKSEGTGSCYFFSLSDGQMLRGGRRSVQPVCILFGDARRSRPQKCFHRRDKAREPGRQIYICLARHSGEESGKSKAGYFRRNRLYKTRAIRGIPLKSKRKYCICLWKRKAQNRQTASMGKAGCTTPAVDAV